MSRIGSADPAFNALVIAVFHLNLYEHIPSLSVLACVLGNVNSRRVIYRHELGITYRCRLAFIKKFEFAQARVVPRLTEPHGFRAANRLKTEFCARSQKQTGDCRDGST